MSKFDRLRKALLETAKDMQHAGLMDEADYRKITLRHLGVKKNLWLDH